MGPAPMIAAWNDSTDGDWRSMVSLIVRPRVYRVRPVPDGGECSAPAGRRLLLFDPFRGPGLERSPLAARALEIQHRNRTLEARPPRHFVQSLLGSGKDLLFQIGSDDRTPAIEEELHEAVAEHGGAVGESQ